MFLFIQEKGLSSPDYFARSEWIFKDYSCEQPRRKFRETTEPTIAPSFSAGTKLSKGLNGLRISFWDFSGE